ncbi:unnamed protein product, partial [marine sediment metagenome]
QEEERAGQDPPLNANNNIQENVMNWTIVCVVLLSTVCLPFAAAEKPNESAKLFRETYRPQFHYTTQKGWINDPIGLVFYKGEYHLFNDHNVASCRFPRANSGL